MLTTTILTGLDPHWLSLAASLLGSENTRCALLLTDIDLTEPAALATLHSPTGPDFAFRSEGATCCVTCALREVIVPALQQAHAAGATSAVCTLPAGLEAGALLPSLTEHLALEAPEVVLAQTIHIVDCDTIVDQCTLEGSVALIEALGETEADFTRTALAEASLVVAVGDHAAGSALIDQFRPRHTRRLDSLARLGADVAFTVRDARG